MLIQSSTQFLARLSPSQNSWIQHRFSESRTSGPDDPSIVLDAVKRKLHNDPDQARALEMLKAFEDFPEEALALAAHNIGLRARTPEQKAQRDATHRRQYFSQQPPTAAQEWKLREALKYTGPIESKQHAMDLITQRLESRN